MRPTPEGFTPLGVCDALRVLPVFKEAFLDRVGTLPSQKATSWRPSFGICPSVSSPSSPSGLNPGFTWSFGRRRTCEELRLKNAEPFPLPIGLLYMRFGVKSSQSDVRPRLYDNNNDTTLSTYKVCVCVCVCVRARACVCLDPSHSDLVHYRCYKEKICACTSSAFADLRASLVTGVCMIHGVRVCVCVCVCDRGGGGGVNACMPSLSNS